MEVGEYPDVQARVRAGRLPALRRSAVHARVPDDRDAASAPTASSPSTTTCASAAPTARSPARTRRATRPIAPTFAYGEPMPNETKRRDDARLARRDQVHVLRRPHRRGPRQGPEARRRPRGDAGLRQRVHRAGAAVRRPRRPAEQRLAAARREPVTSACTRSSAPGPASTTCGTRKRGEQRELRTPPLAADELGLARRRNFICGGTGAGLIVAAALRARMKRTVR